MVNDVASFVLACDVPNSMVEVFEMSAPDIAQRNTTLNLYQVFSDTPATEGILAVHHFRVSNDATVAYPLNKDVSATGTGSDEEETDKVEASGMHEEGTDEAFDITVKDWSVVIYIMANCTSVKFSHSNETVGCLASFDNIVKTG